MRVCLLRTAMNSIVLLLLFAWPRPVMSQDLSAKSGGFRSLRQTDISFENLPVHAPPNLVGVVPSSGRNFLLSPNDRWLFLSEGYLGQGYGQVLKARNLTLIDTNTWKQVAFSPVKAGRDSVYAFRAVFSPNGQLMFTVSTGSNWEHSLQLWNMSGVRPELVAFFHISSRLDDEVYDAWRHLNYSASRTNIVSNTGKILIAGRDRTALLSVQGKRLTIDLDAPIGGDLAAVSEDFERISFLKRAGEIWDYKVVSDQLIGIRKRNIPLAEIGGKIDLDHASASPNGRVLVAIDRKHGACFWSRLGDASSQARVLTDPLLRSKRRKIYGRRSLSADGSHFTLTDSDGEQTVTDVYDQSGARVLAFSHKLPVEYDVRVLPTSDCRHLLVSDRDMTIGFRLLIYRISDQSL